MGRKKPAVFEISLFVSLAVIFIFNHFFYSPTPDPDRKRITLNDLEKQSLELLLEMTKLLFSLSTALFGLVGVFVLQARGNGRPLGRESYRNAVLAFGCAAVSIDFGYVFLEKWVELLANGLFTPFERMVAWPQTLQFTTFLLALFFAGALALRELKDGRKQERPHGKSRD